MSSKFELRIDNETSGEVSVSIWIDGVPFGDDCVDLYELKRSALGSGAYDLQTCGCGVPQCAGFWEPIFVQHDGEIVRWEFDARYHPTVQEDTENLEISVTHYEFDRKQYITEIREKFISLRSHPRKNSIGPHGFDASIFDEEIPVLLSQQLPFKAGAVIVVGYMGDYQQPWVWVENEPSAYPQRLLPSGLLWAEFGCWSLMWESKHFDLGQCIHRKDGVFELKSDVSVAESNQEVEELAQDLQKYWGDVVQVQWDETIEKSPHIFIRHKSVSVDEKRKSGVANVDQ